ncbi:hypothetical protein RHGRI_015314 [Rhododendron griersonianum]|nr:hypothetical protein RHGRI_015314 [Rhododendron griersonianum]
MARGNNDSEGRNNEESINSVHGLDSIVQDSQTPLNEDCLESVNNSSQVQNTETQVGLEQEQERERVNEEDNIPVVYDFNASIRASQVQSINLHVDLNPSAVRQSIISQQFETYLSTEGDEIDGYIIALMEQEQNSVDKELQNTIIVGNNLGIKFGDAGIQRMKKMIENEAKALKASPNNNNSFAPLMRNQ